MGRDDETTISRSWLLPKPFSGVLVWIVAAVAATALTCSKRSMHSSTNSSSIEADPTNSSRDTASPTAGVHTNTPVEPASNAPIVRAGIRDDEAYGYGPRDGAPLPYPTEIFTSETGRVQQEHAYRLGDQLEFDDDEVHVRVTEERPSDGVLVVQIGSGDGLSWREATVRFEREGHRVTAVVEDEGDVQPVPPPAWRSVNGTVRLSSWTLRAPLGIEFELHGWKDWRNRSWSARIFLDK